MNEDGGTPHQHDDEADIDGCTCGIAINEDELTRDAELPAAAGGLQVVVTAHDDEDAIDGCDVDFNSRDVTADEDLPVATGGVG
jgi:hypothetical protein